MVWVDVRGMAAEPVTRRLLERARGVLAGEVAEGTSSREAPGKAAPLNGAVPLNGAAPDGAAPPDGVPTFRVGVAGVPIAAELAARSARDDAPVHVPAGGERAFLAPLPLGLLEPADAAAPLLEGVGLATCGDLAALPREAVEVRFGPEGLRLWRLARADDPRRLFGPIPPERPHASLDFIDYAVTDPARLLFTANALLGGVCDRLQARGEHARRLALHLPLGNGRTWSRVLRAARPTASRDTWLRRLRLVLERLTVPDVVVGMCLEVEASEPAAVRQGDLFDRGFASAPAVEAAVARLAEERAGVAVRVEADAHPLLERRGRWVARAPLEVAEGRDGPKAGRKAAETSSDSGAGDAPALTLQLLPAPRRITVETAPERDHARPVRYHERGAWRALLTAAGPDRISGGEWEEEAYAREYFRCLSEEGVLLWIYHDARRGAWFLHGWWD